MIPTTVLQGYRVCMIRRHRHEVLGKHGKIWCHWAYIQGVLSRDVLMLSRFCSAYPRCRSCYAGSEKLLSTYFPNTCSVSVCAALAVPFCTSGRAYSITRNALSSENRCLLENEAQVTSGDANIVVEPNGSTAPEGIPWWRKVSLRTGASG